MRINVLVTKITKVASLVIAAVMVAGIAKAGSAQGNDPEISDDALAYASAQGLSYEDALSHLAWQERTVELDAVLSARENFSFAGLENVHSPDFTVVVYVTDPRRESPRFIMNASPIANLVDYQVVTRSLMELEYRQNQLLLSLRAEGLELEPRVTVI